MSNEDLIREIVAKACREALQQKSQELAEDVARRAGAALASQLPQPAHTKELRDGARLIASAKTQTETLETLLAAVSAITPACGLMILRGAQAIGWGCHGLATPESFKRATMDCTRGSRSYGDQLPLRRGLHRFPNSIRLSPPCWAWRVRPGFCWCPYC